jgi:thiamine biosynthesis lipoprotein
MISLWRKARIDQKVTAMNRRMVCAIWAGLVCGLIGGGCVSPRTGDLGRFEFSRPEMGVPFRMVLYAADEETATAAATAAFGRVRELNDVFTDYDSDSELSRLSQGAGEGPKAVSAEMWEVLNRAQALAERTGGAFDVTVGPYVNLWRKARRDRALPSNAHVSRARAVVGYEKMKLNKGSRKVELLTPGMRLDLGGIAKGYALDAALEVLADHGIRSALVSGGGDLAVSGAPPGKRGWRIEVAPLDVEHAPPAKFVLLEYRALATSGDVFQHVEIDGKRYSHIVDPRTGVGLTDHSLVTVIARDATTADSLATAASVLGSVAGKALLEKTRGVEGLIVRKPGEEVEFVPTRGFERYLERAVSGQDASREED